MVTRWAELEPRADSSLRSPRSRFYGAAIVFVFEILHTFDCVLLRAGEQRRGLAEFGSGLQSAPREMVRNDCFAASAISPCPS
jgi:hypothetical protein